MEVKRIGSYQETDEHGYLTKLADTSKLQPEWHKATKTLQDAYLDKFGDAVHSIYVRGSIAKGQAVEGVSDLDSFAVVHEGLDPAKMHGQDVFREWALGLEEDLKVSYPFVAGVEVDLTPFDTATDSSSLYAFIIKMEAVCIYGDDLAARLPGYKAGPAIAFQTQNFHSHLAIFLDEYLQEPEEEKPSFIVWMMRRFLRLGMELVMVREQRYTRDLYLCYESFSNDYPEQEENVYQALELAVNPVASSETFAFAKDFGAWLATETQEALAEDGQTML